MKFLRWSKDIKTERLLLTASVVVGALIIGIVQAAIFSARWNFGRHVHVGMTQDEVREAAGAPFHDFPTGAVLDRWGSGRERRVAEREDIWIYSLWPSNSHRVVVTFRDGKVTNIEYQFT